MLLTLAFLLFVAQCQGFRNGMYSYPSSSTRSTFKPSSEHYKLHSPENQAVLKSTLSKEIVVEAEGSGSPCRIKVIGVGGGGGNAVNRMMESSTGVLGVELWTVNTDSQALSRSLAPNKLNIGATTSR